MIVEVTAFLNSLNVPINFVNHITVFIGAFYVAIHNRTLPQWHITPLWYLGLFNLFTAITILIQWIIGAEHPLSYWNMGQIGSTLSNITLAFIVLVIFMHTVANDLVGRRKRRARVKQKDATM